jgi:hypothetical protein
MHDRFQDHRLPSSRTSRVVDCRDGDAAEQYRLGQAAALLREAGFVEGPDGRWYLADDATRTASDRLL